MENADSGVKRARVESPMTPNTIVRVKQEVAEETVGGGESATPTAEAAETPVAAAAAAATRVEVDARIDAAVLDCPLCLLPLKPPIFQVSCVLIFASHPVAVAVVCVQCGAGHLACGICHGKLTDAQCQSCGGDSATAYTHSPALDAFARSTKIRCPNDKYGCDSYVTYCEVADHRCSCRHAPCLCPVPGCGFLATPPALVEHLTGGHSWPAQEITYRNVHLLRVPASELRRLLVVRGEGGAPRHGGAATTVFGVVRAGEREVWAQAPADPETGYKDTIMMDAVVRSCFVPGEVAMEEGAVLSVPPWMLHGESLEMALRVRIDKLRPKN
uniref:SIAH-type domain-containing protein n=1 Tax=Leersia perrieri TaxID=77586 RepID=A0A0D9VTE0_9ORYZ